MKSLFLAALGAATLLASCVSKQVAVEAEHQRDSLSVVVGEKDSLIRAVFDDINAIAGNLSTIRSRENLIAVAERNEGGRRPVEEINSDIAAIDRLLQENRTKIASLQNAAARLRKANLRIEGLEKMIEGLKGELAQKTAEVERLRGELESMGVEVKDLTEQVAQRSAEVEELSGENTELENRLHTVYYIVGAERELRDAQIVDKQGFIGRTLTVNRGGSLESFTKADAWLLGEIPVGHRKATVVTAHPADSYQLITDADKVVTKLVIDDPARFWESSKILVISYK